MDEPDTHLNPLWQLGYLDLIREWTGIAGEADKCQIVVTSHNPLTVATLEREDVRVMFVDDAGKVTVSPPYARITDRNEDQEKQLIAANDKLNRLGFMFEDQEPLYQHFLRAMRDVRYGDRPPLSPEQISQRNVVMKEIVRALIDRNEGAHKQ